MKRLNWLKRRTTKKTTRRQLHRPRLERLEDKLAPAVFTVNSLLDTVDANPGDGLAADANGLTSLRAAVMEANAHAGADQVILPAGPYHLTLAGAGEDLAASGDLDITGDLTITGPGAATTIVDASTIPGGDRVFDCIGSINVHLAGLTVTGGNVVADGGGILNREGALSVSACTITGNTSIEPPYSYYIPGGTGGGIANGDRSMYTPVGTLVIESSTVSGNHASEGGGILNIASATVIGSQISDNSAVHGGGIFNLSAQLTDLSAQLTLVSSTVSGNTAASFGGGIYDAYYGHATINNCTISGNLAQFGAGIDCAGAELSVFNSTITSNGGTIANEAEFGGGLSMFFHAVVSLDHVTLSDNIAHFGSGIINLSAFYGGSITVGNSIIAHNTGVFINLIGSNRNYYSGNVIPQAIISLGHNLDSDGSCGFGATGDLSPVDPLLGPLADNGGPTQTRALLPGSPAIDAGDPLDTTFTDQRGLYRPADGSAISDIGAYEFNATPDVIIGATTPQSFLDSLTEIHGNLILEEVAGRTELHLPNLTQVDGDFIVTDNPHLTVLDAPQLTTVGGTLDVSNNPALTTLNLGSVSTVGGDLNINGDTATTTIDVDSLTTVGGSLNINDDTATTSIDVSSLTTVDGSLNINGDTGTTSIDVSSLTTVGGSLNINGDTATTSIDVSSLTTVDGSLNINGDTATTSIDVSSLTTVDGSLNINGDTATTSIDVSSLTTVDGSLNINGDTATTSIDVSSLTTVGGDVAVSGNTHMTGFSMGHAHSVGGSMTFSDNSSLPSLLLTSLTEVGGDFTLTANPALTMFDVPVLATVHGNANVSDNPAMFTVDLSAFTSVGGSINVSNDTGATNIDLGSLTTATGSINVSNDTGATNIDLGSLTTATGSINVINNTGATIIDLGSLTTASGSVNVDGNAGASTIDLGSLTTATGSVNVSDNTGASTIDLGSLTTASGSVNVDGNTGASTIDLGSLTTASGSVNVDGNTGASTIDLGSLTTIGGNVEVSGNTHMTGLSMGHAHSVGGSMTFSDNSSLPSLLLSSLVEVGGDFTLTAHPALTMFAVPVLASVHGNANVSDNPAMFTVDLSAFTSVGGSISVNNDTAATGIDLSSVTTIGGSLSVNGDSMATGIDLSSVTTIGGSLSVNDDTAATGIDLSSVTTICGSLGVNDDTAATGIDLSDVTTIGGSLSVNNDTTASTIDLSSIATIGGDVSLEASNVITAGTADGSTLIKLFTAEARMTAALAHGTFSGLVPFTVTRLDPAALPPEPGQNSSGGAATIDPLAAYQFHFAIPTFGQNATLSFEINLAALSPADRAAFLAALAAGNATVAVKGDAPGSVFHAFAIAAPGQPPDATHVTLTQPDANHVVFQGITGHFSTFAVVTVTGTGNNAPVVTSLAGPTVGVRGQSLHYTGAFTDPDADTWTATVNFGDGSGNQPVILNLDKTFSFDHTFANTGRYSVVVTVADNHGGSGARSLAVSIAAVALESDPAHPEQTTLVVGGTTGSDGIAVFSLDGHTVYVLMNATLSGPYHPTSAVEVYGQAGNDVIGFVGITTPARAFGGDGNDAIAGGNEADTFYGENGTDALLGFGGNDSLDGGAGNDALDGGIGNDTLQGGAGFLDVLLGGDGNDILSDPDGVLTAWGGNGNDDMTLAFASNWNFNGTSVLPSGAISGGNGDDAIRVTSNNTALQFDVFGDAGNDRIELYGAWNRVRVNGGAGTDTLRNRGVGLIDLNSIEILE